MTTTMAKKWNPIEVKEKLATSDWWVVRAIEAIYSRQTVDEQNAGETKEHNDIGFNGADANILSSFAEQILAYRLDPNPKYPFPLSDRQLEMARKKILKYARQLCEIANSKVDEEGEVALER